MSDIRFGAPRAASFAPTVAGSDDPTQPEGTVVSVEDTSGRMFATGPRPRTTLGREPGTTLGPSSPPPPRRVSRVTRMDVFNVLGALSTGLCVSFLLFGRLAAFSGLLAFVVITYVVFVITYAMLVALGDDGPAVIDKLVTVVLYSIALVILFALGWVIGSTLYKGYKPLLHRNFYTEDLSTTGNFSPLTDGGIKHALVGTIWQVGLALLITAPLGLSCAVYLNEVGGRLARLVRTVAEAMTALPSIVAGLFIYITWIVTFHFGHSGLAAALALAVTMLPIIIRAADVVLRLVPGNLREAAGALGAPTWRTVWHVVLPTARSGLTTAIILGTAWGIGETAPVLLTAGYTTYLNTNPLHGPMVSLPLVAYELVRTDIPLMVERAFAAAAFLLLVVVVLFVIARVIGGRGPGHLSAMGVRRVQRASRRDLARFEALAGEGRPTEGRAPDGGSLGAGVVI